jgi:hypothetical protein
MKERKFKAYVGNPDFHDGFVREVRQESDQVSVEVEGYSGARYVVRFSRVDSVTVHNPEGMMLYALVEMDADAPSRCFVFANSNEPHEEGGDSVLEIIAHSFSAEKI